MGLVLNPPPPEEDGAAGRANEGPAARDDSRRHTFSQRIPKINQTKKNPTQGTTKPKKKTKYGWRGGAGRGGEEGGKAVASLHPSFSFRP